MRAFFGYGPDGGAATARRTAVSHPVRPLPIRIPNHNQTVVRPLQGRDLNHNQTLVRR